MTKVVLITGSSGGIGGALVKVYSDAGFFVIGLDKIQNDNVDLDYSYINIDLLNFAKDKDYREGKVKEIVSIFPTTIGEFVLINNAAEQIIKPLSDISWNDWEMSLAVNTVAPFFFAQSFKEHLSVSYGHVINITSIHAKLTKSYFTCYATSKAALEAVTRSLALELSPLGVSVNAVAPAAISTEMLKSGFNNVPEKYRELEDYHPSKSIGRPEDVAVFVKSISDHKSGFLTGSVLEFNGGIAGKLHDPDA
ncbi:SDR family oxidoreductase [Gammaproteobacteria bacterium]|nr:SDR family oxidoreductase [Gammaproteobacteria bacterium]